MITAAALILAMIGSGPGTGANIVNIQNQYSANQFFTTDPPGCALPSGGVLQARSTSPLRMGNGPCTIVIGAASFRRYECFLGTRPLRIEFEGLGVVCGVHGNLATWNIR